MIPQYDKLVQWLDSEGLDSVLVSRPENIRYFSGFQGSAGLLLITKSKRQLFTDSRYITQATTEAPDFCICKCPGGLLTQEAAREIRRMGFEKIGFESSFVTWDAFHVLKAEVQEDRWVTVKLDFLRQLKTSEEIKLITAAVKIADDAFKAVLPHFIPGACERHLAALLEYEMRKRGADKPAFDTIVASGSRSALPHGVASDKLIETGDFVVVDFGAVFRGYNSDMTRTLCMGKASDKQRKVYETVLTAQLAGIAAVRAGAECVQVDRAARQVVDNSGYGEFFGHGLGHGVGIMIHEEPKLSAGSSADKLAEAMVVTVEPGIYLPDWGGVRIEDLVVVMQDDCCILTQTGKALLEVI